MNQNSETSLLTTLQNSNSGFEKLIYQIAISLKSKYKNIFSIAKYYDNELIDEVQNVLIEKNCPTNYQGAFKIVETEILKTVKSRCPEPPKNFQKPKPVIIDKYEDEETLDPIKKEKMLKER